MPSIKKFRAWVTSGLDSGYMHNFDMSSDGYPRFQWDRVVLEQYTGLKDKNGKEIYEGDIIAEHNGDVIGKIIQAPSGEWRIEWIGIFGGSSSLYGHRDLCEVIGNIHENPELLEG